MSENGLVRVCPGPVSGDDAVYRRVVQVRNETALHSRKSEFCHGGIHRVHDLAADRFALGVYVRLVGEDGVFFRVFGTARLPVRIVVHFVQRRVGKANRTWHVLGIEASFSAKRCYVRINIVKDIIFNVDQYTSPLVTRQKSSRQCHEPLSGVP